MTREDMLRELELLPVWVLNPNAVLPVQAQVQVQVPPTSPEPTLVLPTSPSQADAMAEPDVPAELAVEKSIELPVNPSINQPVAETNPEALVATASSAINEVQIPSLQVPSLQALSLPESTLISEPQAMPDDAAPQREALHASTKTPIAWMLVCPADVAPNEASLALLNNMIKAMQLLQTEVVVVQQAPDLTAYQAQKVVCFGLDAFNQYLAATQATEAQHANTQAQDSALEALRGKPHMHQATACWVTYHPAQLLANPALKRGAWQDLCAAIAHVG
jgi:DNA polymerase III psi subunit